MRSKKVENLKAWLFLTKVAWIDRGSRGVLGKAVRVVAVHVFGGCRVGSKCGWQV